MAENDDLTDIPGVLRAELTRLRANQEVLTQKLKGKALRTETSGGSHPAQGERDALRTELRATREERDRLRLLLLDSELELNRRRDCADLLISARAETIQLRRQLHDLTEELATTHRTVSWRVTAPLRAVRRKTKQ